LLITLSAGIPLTRADTSLTVDLGWGSSYRLGRWAPVFVTASDDRTRAVMIEVYVPHDQIHGMVIRQFVTIGPTPSTFPLYAPFPNSMETLTVTIRADGPFGRKLADWSVEKQRYSRVWGGISAVGQLIGVSGRGSNLDSLLPAQFGDPERSSTISPTLRWMSRSRLPFNAIGFDSLDALMLDEPDLARMAREQQDAVIDWVRSGGHLVCWIGIDPPPASSPIMDQLPAEVGSNILTDLTEESLRAAGLPPRFRQLKARQLVPRLGSESINLFGGESLAIRRRLGFGTITLLPFNPSTFMFQSPAQANAFWEPIIGQAVRFPDKNAKPGTPQYYTPYNDPMQQRRSLAINEAMQQLGGIPGAGAFGFGYVATVMIGLMLVVGPLDWIVLKKLNRQPWTWATTTGWIALVSLGAVYIGYVFKSGDLHFRTLSLLDQADGMVQARFDATGVYSPRTQNYSLKVDPEGWWQPMSTQYYGTASRAFNDIYFRQDQHGTRAGPTRVNVWNLLFLEGQTIGPSQPMIESDLHVESKDSVKHVVGTLTNHGSAAMSGILIRVEDKVAQAPVTLKIEPGTTTTIDLALALTVLQPRQVDVPVRLPDGTLVRSAQRNTNVISMQGVWDLSPGRSERVDRLLSDHADLACVYAVMQDVPAVVSLDVPGATEKHVQYVRALVPIKRGEP
jgi:hypothetical protein